MSLRTIRVKRLNVSELPSNIYHFCFGLLSVLYIVNVPGLNISLGTVILVGFTPYSLYYLLKGIRTKRNASPFFFFIFYLYLIFRSDANAMRIILCIAAFVNLAGQMAGAIKVEKIRSVVEGFAVLNAVLLFIQVLSFYILHITIQYIPRDLIYEEYRNSWVFNSVSGLYRPSALFLEPSHFSQFCIFALISTLFPHNGIVNKKRAMIIGAGCVLTTSGMGIALTVGVVAWYIFLNRERLDRKILIILKWIPVGIIGLLILSRMSFFQTALQRVFSNVEGYNAISGRTHNWDDAIGSMKGQLLWLGYGDSYNYRWYLTGLADSIYKYGVVCIILEGLCFVYLMLKKRTNFVWLCSIVFAVLFCVAHITNFASQVFYFGFILSEVCAQTRMSNVMAYKNIAINARTLS